MSSSRELFGRKGLNSTIFCTSSCFNFTTLMSWGDKFAVVMTEGLDTSNSGFSCLNFVGLESLDSRFTLSDGLDSLDSLFTLSDGLDSLGSFFGISAGFFSSGTFISSSESEQSIDLLRRLFIAPNSTRPSFFRFLPSLFLGWYSAGNHMSIEVNITKDNLHKIIFSV